jgi:hypothetical protein
VAFLIDLRKKIYIWEYRVEGKILSFNASMVHVDVYVEMLQVTLHVTLPFGPFDRIADAQEWADALESAHARDQLLENNMEIELNFDDNDMPTRPYLSMHMSVTMVAERKQARRLAKYLLAPDTPEKTLPMLAEYALRTSNEAIAHSCFLLDKGG